MMRNGPVQLRYVIDVQQLVEDGMCLSAGANVMHALDLRQSSDH